MYVVNPCMIVVQRGNSDNKNDFLLLVYRNKCQADQSDLFQLAATGRSTV